MKVSTRDFDSIRKRIYWIHGFTLQLVMVLTVVPLVTGQCPSKLKMHSFSCFSDYNTQFLNMQNSPRTLFSGVDVELLRSFCSAFMSAMSCIERLKADCGEAQHHVIDVPLINLNGATDELSMLCKNDDIYEVYARHMSCYMSHGSHSERCFVDVMNTTSRFLKRVHWTSLDDLCGELSAVLHCIKTTIVRSCGEEAARLMDVLTKPMVRSSTMCDQYDFTTRDYSETYRRTTFLPPEGTNRRVISVRQSDPYNGGRRTRYPAHTLLLCVVVCVLFGGSHGLRERMA